MLNLTPRSFMLRRKAPSRAAEAERRDSAGITCGNPGLLSKTEPRASRMRETYRTQSIVGASPCHPVGLPIVPRTSRTAVLPSQSREYVPAENGM